MLIAKLLLTATVKDRVKDGLTGWYSGQPSLHTTTQWLDQSGNNRHGALTAITWGTNYAQFNGVSSMVSFGVQNSAKVTFDAYVEWTAISTSQEVIISNLSDSSPYTGAFLRKGTGAGEVGMGVAIGGTVYYANDGVPPIAGVKYHYVGCFDGSKIDFFKNGALVSSTNQSGSISNSVRRTFGARNDNKNFARIKIYDAAIYNKALIPEQVNLNYQYCRAVYGL